MDRALLEFWSTLLGEAARNPQRWADLTRLMTAGMQGSQGMASAMSAGAGTGSGLGSATPPTWPLDPAAFQKAYQALAACFGMVPRAEHDRLQHECAQLRQQLIEAQTTIEQLRLELAGSRLGQGDAISGLTQLIEVQHQQFEKLQQEVGRFWQQSDAKKK